MKTIGSLILLIALALIVVVGVIATDSMTSEANTTAADTARDVISPIFMVLGFGVLIIGSMIAVSAFS